VATCHTFREAEDPTVGEQARGLLGRDLFLVVNGYGRWGPQGVFRRACDDIASEIIQGDLVGSEQCRRRRGLALMGPSTTPDVSHQPDRQGCAARSQTGS
jgi:hypothetical protein